MTILMGVLARCLYAIGDIALYKGVLGYEFRDSTLRRACGSLSLLGFAGILAILPTAGYVEWVMYGMLWLGMLLLFKQLQLGLVVFVFLTRITVTNLMDNMIYHFKGEDFFWKNTNTIIIIHSLAVVLIITVFIFCNKGEKFISKEIIMNNQPIIRWGIVIMIIITSSYYFENNISEELLQSILYRMRLKDNLIGIILVCFFVIIMISREKQRKLAEQLAINDRCIREQTEQYRMLNEKQKELRGFRHDINGHLLVMRRMASQGEYDELTGYLDKLSALQEETFYLSSNNIIGDAIFNFYYDKGCSDGIEVKVVGKFPDKLVVAETDLCIVLSNTVANAYEAALKCGVGSVVTAELSGFCGRTMIVITNPVSEEPEIKDGIMTTTKENKENHGLGISNTIRALEKYDGQITWEKSGKEIVTKIVF